MREDTLGLFTRPGPIWWLLLGASVAGACLFFCSWLTQIIGGVGVTGLSNPVGWGVYVVSFFFWIGVAQGGILISALLLLFRVPWRRPFFRIAEVMTISALMTAGFFPLIHLGRVWYAYWLIPYPNSRFLWPNFHSPILWDLAAVAAFSTLSALLFYLGAIPDLAWARDHFSGRKQKLYRTLALGWRGADREWYFFGMIYPVVAACAAVLALTLNSVVSWDLAMSTVPGWQADSIHPHFLAGALLSGLAMVVTLILPFRKNCRLEEYLTLPHLDSMAKLVLLTSIITFGTILSEFLLAWFSGEDVVRAIYWNRLFGEYWAATWIIAFCVGFLPAMLWYRRVRKSLRALFGITLFINIGMWLHPLVTVVSSATHAWAPFAEGSYWPSMVEAGILVGSCGWFLLCFLLLTRIIPPVAIVDWKRGGPASPPGGGEEGAVS